MILSSARKHWANRLLFLSLVSAPLANAAPIYSYQGSFDARLADHTGYPDQLASQRLGVSLEQDISFNPKWKAALGFSGWDEPVYAAYPDRYPASVAHNDSRDLRLRNVFIQYNSEHFFLKAGNQQVVWGEAFGYFYADIVNPRDLRDGAFGDFTDVRLQEPMLNSKIIFDRFALQGIYIPQRNYNYMPLPGSDFAYPITKLFPNSNLTVNRQTSAPLSLAGQEFGARMSYNLSRWDLSLFYFNYFDRSPYYVLNSASQIPQNLIIDERHAHLASYGFTATNDFGIFVFRSEALFTQGRLLPVITNSQLGVASLNNYTYVLGFDLPTWKKWNFGLQWSQDLLPSAPLGLLRTANQSLASLRIQRPFFRNHSAELLLSYSTADLGERVQFNYILPVSDVIETRLGVDVLAGPVHSDFGEIRDASRGYVLLKYFVRD